MEYLGCGTASHDIDTPGGEGALIRSERMVAVRGENEIVPLYYNRRSSDKLPGEWIARIKESIRTLAPQFSMKRMLKEYVNDMYLPAMLSEAKPEAKPKAAAETKHSPEKVSAAKSGEQK